MPVEVVSDKEAWDTFVDAAPSGLLFHRWDFLKVTGRWTGYTVLPYGIYRGEELIAVCPLFHKRICGLSIVLSPPPLQAVVPYLGVVMGRGYTAAKQSRRESMLQAIAEGLRDISGNLAPDYFSMNLVPGFRDIRRFNRDGYRVGINYTYAIDLAPPLEILRENLNKKLRANIRKFEKDGYFMEQGDDLGPFYEAVSRRFSSPDMNVPLITRQYFEEIFGAYPDHVHVYYLYNRSGEVKGVGTTQEYKRYILWVGGPKIDGTPANEYFQWLQLMDAKEKGFSEFENTGANNPNLNMHKAKYNPALAVYLELSRKNSAGRVAEWVYSSIANRSWIKKRFVPYIE